MLVPMREYRLSEILIFNVERLSCVTAHLFTEAFIEIALILNCATKRDALKELDEILYEILCEL